MNWRLAFAVIPVVAMATGSLARAESSPPTSAEVEARIDKLMAEITPDEKLKLLTGIEEFYSQDIPRLNIPRMKMSDATVGVRCYGPSTAYPAVIALAATWDPQVAKEQGVGIGRDARSRGVHVLLGPGMNIYRQAQCGRNFEYMGEDPYLAGEMAVPLIQGIQSQGVAACAKHYVANEQEDNRMSGNSQIDERTLQEIYLPPFKAAVQKGHVWTIMTAYNKLNGPHCTENDWLQNQVLKQDWGFAGQVMSDWGATHSTAAALNHGLDLEMPGGEFFTPERIKPLLESGKVSQQVIDDHVRRTLRVMVAMGFMDREQEDPTIARSDAASSVAALKVAREGIVLLKNQNNLLPLDAQKARTIVFVGPITDRAVTGGGGSSYVKPILPGVSIAKGISHVVGESKTTVIPWQSFADKAKHSIYDPIDNAAGLKVEFFDGTNLEGTPVLTRTDAQIDFNWKDKKPVEQLKSVKFSARWTGKITPKNSGDYLFFVASDDGSRVFVDGKPVIDFWNDHGIDDRSASVRLDAGKTYDLKVEYYNAGGLAEMRFGYGKVETDFTPEQLQLIQSADVVVAGVGFNCGAGTYEGEGIDRSYHLPLGQDELLASVSKLNPRTIVVLNTGGNVDMNQWADRSGAIIQNWYPGQYGNTALAEILFGQISPSGKLPVTFEKKWEDSPAYGNYPGEHSSPKFAEGIYVGYRHFDTKNVEPRFPFGFGLTYSTFDMTQPMVGQSIDGDKKTWIVSATLTNTGQVEAAEVAQLYLRPAKGPIDRPMQELKAFARVHLKPGESKDIDFKLDDTSFQCYDPATKKWITQPGPYEAAIGFSSRDIRKTVKLTP